MAPPYIPFLIILKYLNTGKDAPHGGKNDPFGNPQADHHSSCHNYYDKEMMAAIENGPERFIYDQFCYEGCCLKQHSWGSYYSHGKKVHPYPAGTPEVGASSLSSLNLKHWCCAFLVFGFLVLLILQKRERFVHQYLALPKQEDENDDEEENLSVKHN